MGFKLIYAPEIYNDLQENINWYNEKIPGLGHRFYKAVKTKISVIKKNPYALAIRYDDIRCGKVKDFPFMIHFKIFPETNLIKVIAVFSTHRNPDLWYFRNTY